MNRRLGALVAAVLALAVSAAPVAAAVRASVYNTPVRGTPGSCHLGYKVAGLDTTITYSYTVWVINGNGFRTNMLSGTFSGSTTREGYSTINASTYSKTNYPKVEIEVKDNTSTVVDDTTARSRCH